MSPHGAGRRALALIGLALLISMSTACLFKAALELALPHSQGLRELVRYGRVAPADAPADAAPASKELASPEGSPSPETAAAVRYDYDLGRAARRYLLLIGLALFLGFRRWLPWARAFRQGIRRDQSRMRHAAYGLALALGVVGVYTVILLVGGFVSPASPALSYMARKVPEFIIGACLIAFVEELFFRGILMRGLVRDYGVCVGLVVSSTVYAAVHCISGGYRVEAGWQPLIGLRLAHAYFTDHGGTVVPDLRLIAGLLLLGLLLGYLALRTGSLWAPMGLHAGVVLVSKLLKKLVDRHDGFPQWLLGDPLFIVSGVVCWVILGVALVVAVRTAPRGLLYQRLSRRS